MHSTPRLAPWCVDFAKPIAAAGFVAAAFANGALDSAYGQWILAGLVLSFVGDVLLIPREAKSTFFAGLVSFLLGHVAYTGAIAVRGLDPVATAVAALPAGPAKDQGLAIGAARAARVLAQRANDGRWADVTAAVPGTAPGAFRGTNPINQTLPKVRPFLLDSVAQFRSAPPPALDSAAGGIHAPPVPESRLRPRDEASGQPRVYDAGTPTLVA